MAENGIVDLVSASKKAASAVMNSEEYKETKRFETQMEESGKLVTVRIGNAVIRTTNPEKWKLYERMNRNI